MYPLRSIVSFAALLIMGVCVATFAAGCNRNGKVAVYDNDGGFAYPGYRITFFPSGQYLSESYTDVKGQRPNAQKGPFKKKGETYVLGGVGGQKTFHILKVNGVEYLLDHFAYDDYVRTQDSDKLREAMRRGA